MGVARLMPRDLISTCTGKSLSHTISLIRYFRSFLPMLVLISIP